MPFQLIQPNT